jgi:hypothetical protein
MIYGDIDYSSDDQGDHESEEDEVEIKIIQPLVDSPSLPELSVEILGLVCTHLSQSTLRYGFSQVCKKWHEVADRFINHTGTWLPLDGVQEQLLQQWPRLKTLELWFNLRRLHPIEPEFISTKTASWNTFAAAITEPISTNIKGKVYSGDDGDSAPIASSCLLHTIRHLEIRGLYMIYSEIGPDLRGHLQFIESLTIANSRSNECTPLFTILADFPALKSFNLTLCRWSPKKLSHGDEEDDIDYDLEQPRVDDSWKMFPERYRLQRFCINNLRTDLRVLERVIVTCPNLREFCARDLSMDLIPQPGESNDGAELSSEAEDAEAEEQRNDRRRLCAMAAKYCPKLEWYSFHLYSDCTDENYLEYVAHTFPDQKMHSMELYDYPERRPGKFAVRDLLSKTTVLDIEANESQGFISDSLNKILCLMPNLLHLVGSETYFSTSSLWQPPIPVEPAAPKRVFATVGDRKRYERRQARKQALNRSRSDVPVSAAANDNTPTAVDDSCPATWQVYRLKTLKLNMSYRSSVVQFTDYISQHRLFRNLVTFNLQIYSLKIGQQKTPADYPKKYPSRHRVKDDDTPSEPTRFPNELLALRGLQCLEECILRAIRVPGTVTTRNFKFLQRKGDLQTISFPTTTTTEKTVKKKKWNRRNKNSALKMSPTGDGHDEGEDEDEEEEGWMTERTFWPKLTAFHIHYNVIEPSTNTIKLAKGITHIRPGVVFRFQSHYSRFNDE